MSLALIELMYNVLCSNLHTDSKHEPRTYRTWKVSYTNQPTPNKALVELKDNSINGNIRSDVGQVAIHSWAISVLKYLAVLQVDNLVWDLLGCISLTILWWWQPIDVLAEMATTLKMRRLSMRGATHDKDQVFITINCSNISFDVQNPLYAIELSSTQWDFLLEVSPLWFPLVAFYTKPIVSLHLWCMLGCHVWIWMKSNLFWFIEGQTHYSTLACSWTNIECSLSKTPQYPQECTRILPNLESVVCETTNSQPKVPLNSKL
jgi:hypothetical protein